MVTDYLPVYPPLRLDHLARLTDDTGIMQHALFTVPDPIHGYSIDDQARALIVTLLHARLSGMQHAPRAAYTYMSFLRLAANAGGTFHNFLSYARHWLDEQGSQDAQGRALWALAYAARFGIDGGLCGAAGDLFAAGVANVEALDAPRAWAFAIYGLYHQLCAERSETLLAKLRLLADRLVALYDATAGPDWRWFEHILTYCNGKLPGALLLAYELTGEERYREVGLSALSWLMTVLFDDHGVLRLVGQHGWYPRGGTKAPFDEQCVDAQGTVEAALIALRITREEIWRSRARSAFDWFVGRNAHAISLIDPATWGCFDGITRERLNRNMGAESIVCYLLAYLDLVAAGILTLEGAIPAPD
ncbi:MAG TPA: hypothetical protein VHB98_19300 [Chloroflexota bacterium]|nr:hypothetical protein [Chloroflexota bacterium]